MKRIDFKRNSENFSKSGGWALGSVISNIHSMKYVESKHMKDYTITVSNWF